MYFYDIVKNISFNRGRYLVYTIRASIRGHASRIARVSTVDALLVKHAACTLLGCKAGYHSAEGQIAANFVTREDRS